MASAEVGMFLGIKDATTVENIISFLADAGKFVKSGDYFVNEKQDMLIAVMDDMLFITQNVAYGIRVVAGEVETMEGKYAAKLAKNDLSGFVMVDNIDDAYFQSMPPQMVSLVKEVSSLNIILNQEGNLSDMSINLEMSDDTKPALETIKLLTKENAGVFMGRMM
jgi:hypothetical protein